MFIFCAKCFKTGKKSPFLKRFIRGKAFIFCSFSVKFWVIKWKFYGVNTSWNTRFLCLDKPIGWSITKKRNLGVGLPTFPGWIDHLFFHHENFTWFRLSAAFRRISPIQQISLRCQIFPDQPGIYYKHYPLAPKLPHPRWKMILSR